MLQFGVHLYTLYDHLVFRYKEPKFFELLFHHLMSVFLIFYSYVSNTAPMGILVLFTHDPGDVMLDLNRVLNDWNPRLSNVIDFTYVAFVISWIFLRLGVFPGCLVTSTVEFVKYLYVTDAVN